MPAPNPSLTPGADCTTTAHPRATGGLRQRVSLPLLFPLLICATLSGVMTWLTIGFVDDFPWRWLTSFITALPMMALGLMLMSACDKLLHKVMAQAGATQRKLVLAGLMALSLELMMSSVVTLRTLGWTAGFVSAWASTFLRSLPIGLCIGLLMGFVIGPRLQRRATLRTEV